MFKQILPSELENVKAYIVPTAEAKCSLNADDIITYAKKHLSAYKVPHLIEFRDELPLSHAGKILSRVLKDENHMHGL